MSAVIETDMRVRSENKRQALIEQLAYLLDEIGALQRLLERVPDAALSEKPLDKWSIKEVFGHLADCDREIFGPRASRIVSDSRPHFENVEQDALVEKSGWNDRPFPEILVAVQEARQDLVATFDSIPEEKWPRTGIFPDGVERDLFDLAFYVTQHDAHHLRSVATLLHESHLTDRPVDIPK